ncbi:hypothetical protein HanIR_Chr09g0421931 [Helianthus annuus]|nr:hypothetical protein HanIR_Chr09g0421931 [Helianthus annuus]
MGYSTYKAEKGELQDKNIVSGGFDLGVLGGLQVKKCMDITFCVLTRAVIYFVAYHDDEWGVLALDDTWTWTSVLKKKGAR